MGSYVHFKFTEREVGKMKKLNAVNYVRTGSNAYQSDGILKENYCVRLIRMKKGVD